MLKFLSSVKFLPSGQKIFILFILKDKQPHYKKVKSYCSFVVLCLSECYFVVFFRLTFVILHLLASSTLLFLLILKIIRSNQLWYSYLSICHIKKKSRKMVNKGERGMIMDFQVYSFPEWLTVSIAKLPLNSSSFFLFPSHASVSFCSLLIFFLLLFQCFAGTCRNFPLELSLGKARHVGIQARWKREHLQEDFVIFN